MLGFKRNTLLLFVVSCLFLAEGVDKYTDENRPYEFGFNIEGEQHRHEKKDENGIIMGEYGFITADGVYHVTAYATDENGGFRILSMKNIRVRPFPTSGDSSRQGHSIPVQQIPQAAPSPPPPPPPPPTPRAPTREFVTPPAAPVVACSSCSIPLSTPAPQLNPASVSIQTQNSPKPHNYPQSGIGDYPQNPASQNYPQQANEGFNQNYPQSANADFNQVNGQQSNAAFNGNNAQHSNADFDQNNAQQANGNVNQNYQQPQQFSPGSSPNDVILQNQYDQFNPQDKFGPNGPQTALGAPNVRGDSSYTQEIPNNQQNYQSQGAPDRNPKQFLANAEAYGEVGPEKPQLIAAQMSIVNGDTDVNYLAPGEQAGLPEGVTQGDLERIMYVFNYTVGFHGHYEEGYANGNKKGYYYVTGRNGVKTRVDYEADENGFRPKITSEVLDLISDEVPKEETEKDDKYGLKSYEFKWLYYPVESRR